MEIEEKKEAEKVEEKTAPAPETESKQPEETEKKTEEVKTEEPAPEPEPVAEVPENQPANAVRVEDLVTKDELKERLDAIISRLDSVLHENESLKDQLAKYDGDFGTSTPKGTAPRSEDVEDTFESYSRDFMK